MAVTFFARKSEAILLALVGLTVGQQGGCKIKSGEISLQNVLLVSLPCTFIVINKFQSIFLSERMPFFVSISTYVLPCLLIPITMSK